MQKHYGSQFSKCQITTHVSAYFIKQADLNTNFPPRKEHSIIKTNEKHQWICTTQPQQPPRQ